MTVRLQRLLRTATPDDLPDAAALSAEIHPHAGSRERARAEFTWKYHDHSEGSCGAVLEEDDGSLAAFVGGVPARAMLDGEPVVILQSTDHLVKPECRSGLRRLGRFARTMRWWCTHYCNPSAHRIGYGFPSSEDARIGARVARYELIRPINLLFSSDLERLALLHSGGMRFELALTPPTDTDALWARSAPREGITVIRDHAYLSWRFSRHPTIEYTFLAVRDRFDKLRGIAVVRVGGIAEDLFTIVDWIAPTDDTECFRELLYALGRFTASRGYGGLCVWFAEPTPEFARAQECGFRVRPTSLLFVGRSFDRSIRIDSMRHGFRTSLGDTDFF